MDQQDYPNPYPTCLGYEMQIQPHMAHKTHTLPHPHHHHQHTQDRNRTRDDQSLGYHGNMSGSISYCFYMFINTFSLLCRTIFTPS